MKYLFFCFLSLSSVLFVEAQDIAIGIVVPEEQEGIGKTAFNLLASKLQNLVSEDGISVASESDFVIYPTINIVKKQLVEGGLRSFSVMEIGVTLVIHQVSSQKNFSSTTITLHGNGRNNTEAAKEAFSKMNASDPILTSFVRKARRSIENYYVRNKVSIMQKANSLAVSKQYDEAFALLSSYPQSISGYAEIQAQICSIYRKYQTGQCNQLINAAKAALATQDYEGATKILINIDPESSCNTQATVLLKQIRSDIKANITRSERIEQMERNRQASLKKTRINAVKEMVQAYYRRKPPITYLNVFTY